MTISVSTHVMQPCKHFQVSLSKFSANQCWRVHCVSSFRHRADYKCKHKCYVRMHAIPFGLSAGHILNTTAVAPTLWTNSFPPIAAIEPVLPDPQRPHDPIGFKEVFATDTEVGRITGNLSMLVQLPLVISGHCASCMAFQAVRKQLVALCDAQLALPRSVAHNAEAQILMTCECFQMVKKV